MRDIVRDIVRDTLRGCGYLPGYGEHPGTLILLLLVAYGALAGGAGGAAIMAGICVPAYLVGAHDRGRRYRERQPGSQSDA